MSANDLDPIFQSAAQKFNLDPDLLRAIAQQESSMNPKAVGPQTDYGVARGLMGILDSNAKKAGIDSHDPSQAIPWAANNLRNSINNNNGDLDRAVKEYFGGPNRKIWGPKTNQYVVDIGNKFGKIKSNSGFVAADKPQQTQSDDPILQALSGKTQTQSVSALSAPTSDDPILAALSGKQVATPGVNRNIPIIDDTNNPNPQNNGFRVEVSGTSTSKPQTAESPSIGGELLRQAGLTARAGVSGLAGIPNMLGDAANSLINVGTSGINSLTGSNIPQMQLPSQATQELMTKAGLPEPKNGTERVVQNVAGAMAGVAPSVGLGSLLGSTGNQAAQAIGQGLQQAPGVQMLGSAGAGAGGGMAQEAGLGPLGQLGAALGGALLGTGIGSGISRLASGGSNTAQMLMVQALKDQENNAAGAAKPRIKLNLDGTQTVIEPTSEQVLPKTFMAPVEAPMPNASTLRTQLNSQQQLKNIDLLKKIGLEEQRPSAISGDKFAAGQEFETAKLNNQVGEIARNQLAKEQNALKTFAQGILEDAGAPIASLEASGQTIRAPMQALSQHFDQQISNIYQAADQAASGAPIVKLSNLGDFLNTNSTFSGKAENLSLRRGVRAYMKEQGMNIDSQLQPVDVKASEGLRQYLNSQWSPQNSGLIGRIKEALDTDVTKAAGPDLYKDARALHATRKNTLDNPNGIAKLLNTEGPNGINQSIPDEQVGQKLIGMPTNQFKHIVDTLKNLPEGLADQGSAAIAEIKASIAKKIYSAGDSGGTQNGPSVWNASNVTKELNKQRSKLAIVFEPQELDKFKTLNDAGHILQTPSAYKGAAAQGYNYLQSGVLTGLPAAGAGIGAIVGGPTGAAAGGGLGSIVGSVAKKSFEKSMASRYSDVLRNPAPQFPK